MRHYLFYLTPGPLLSPLLSTAITTIKGIDIKITIINSFTHILIMFSSNCFLETDGRDTCCIVTCLTQLLLDPYFRTIHGFQSLVQREWVIMGHPFCTRLAHVYQQDVSNQVQFFYNTCVCACYLNFLILIFLEYIINIYFF